MTRLGALTEDKTRDKGRPSSCQRYSRFRGVKNPLTRRWAPVSTSGHRQPAGVASSVKNLPEEEEDCGTFQTAPLVPAREDPACPPQKIDSPPKNLRPLTSRNTKGAVHASLLVSPTGGLMLWCRLPCAFGRCLRRLHWAGGTHQYRNQVSHRGPDSRRSVALVRHQLGQPASRGVLP